MNGPTTYLPLTLALLLGGCLSDGSQGRQDADTVSDSRVTTAPVDDTRTPPDTQRPGDTQRPRDTAPDTQRPRDTAPDTQRPRDTTPDTQRPRDTAPDGTDVGVPHPMCPLPRLDMEVEWGVGSTFNDAAMDEWLTVVSYGRWTGGANFDWAAELVRESGEQVRLRGRLAGRPLPITAGESLRLVVERSCPFWCNTLGALIDAQGVVRLFYYDGSLGGVRCLEGAYCVSLAADGICPVQDGCARATHPELSLSKTVYSNPSVSLYQGMSQTFDSTNEALVAAARHLTDVQCTDTPSTWVHVAVVGEPSHADCDPDVLTLTRDNPDGYELYELCHPAAAVDPTPDLQAIDPTITCPSGGLFARCKQSEVACMGQLTYADPATRALSDDKWAQLCKLSKLGWVTRIVGGHYL